MNVNKVIYRLYTGKYVNIKELIREVSIMHQLLQRVSAAVLPMLTEILLRTLFQQWHRVKARDADPGTHALETEDAPRQIDRLECV